MHRPANTEALKARLRGLGRAETGLRAGDPLTLHLNEGANKLPIGPRYIPSDNAQSKSECSPSGALPDFPNGSPSRGSIPKPRMHPLSKRKRGSKEALKNGKK